MPSPKYTRRHYVQIAGVIARLEPVSRKEFADKHAAEFAADNPRFDRKRFFNACGLPEFVEAKEGK